MILITAHLQVPEFGINTHIDWAPNFFNHVLQHLHIAMTFDIVVLTQIPMVQINYTSNIVYEH
jgi:hypothetical protein